MAEGGAEGINPNKPPVSGMMKTNFRMVYFSLGTREGNDINKIVGVCKHKEFIRYIIPTGAISKTITKQTGLSKKETKGTSVLSFKGEPLDTVSMKEALEAFIDWLTPLKPCMLLTHDTESDADDLINHLIDLDQKMYNQFTDVVCGVCDTREVFKDLYPGRHLRDLVQDILSKTYNQYEGINDAKMLQDLAAFSDVNKEMAIRHSRHCVYWRKFSLQDLVDDKSISSTMKGKFERKNYDYTRLRTLATSLSCKEFASELEEVTKNPRILLDLYDGIKKKENDKKMTDVEKKLEGLQIDN